MWWDKFGCLYFFSPGRCRVIPQKNHYFVPLFQCVHKCLHNPCTAAVQTTHATSISNPNRGGCMENWGVYAKPYVPCPWIIKLLLLEQRDLWRLWILQVCRKQDYIQQLHPSFSPVEAYLVHLNKQETEFGPTLSYTVSASTFIYISFP